MNYCFQKNDRDNIENFMDSEKLQYFSCTIFDWKFSELLSICSNKDWNDCYRENYRPNPPVKKYILQKRNGIIWWDTDLFDQNTAHYITHRNDVCNTSMICTFVPEGAIGIGAISFGSNYGQKHLIEIIEKRPEELKRMFKSLLN